MPQGFSRVGIVYFDRAEDGDLIANFDPEFNARLVSLTMAATLALGLVAIYSDLTCSDRFRRALLAHWGLFEKESHVHLSWCGVSRKHDSCRGRIIRKSPLG